MGNYEAWSADKAYGLRIPSKVVARILKLCEDATHGVETGGILVGYYTKQQDCAIVSACSAAPKDSESGKHYFRRGIHGLQEWLNSLWNRGRRRYYLGDWHYHPAGSPVPSQIDIDQMKTNAEDDSYSCPEPIMVIIAGEPPSRYSIGSSVYVRGRGMITLVQGWESRRQKV